jgi:hypothetical protein
MKKDWYKLGFVLTVCALMLGGCCCISTQSKCAAGNPDRTEGCDEFTPLQNFVKIDGSSFTDPGWYPLDTGDTLTTDANGEAEMNLSECWPGHIYVFKNSAGAFHVEQCSEAEFESASATCVSFGTWYVGSCAAEFDVIWTGSAKITKTGTSFSVTYLPKMHLTLIVVLEGEVSLEAVNSYGPTELEEGATPVSAGSFYFTMPIDDLNAIAELNPREVYSVDKLPPVAQELDIVDQMLDVHDQAGADGVLPNNWPQEMGMEMVVVEEEMSENAFVITMGGGALSDPKVQEGMLTGVDWWSIAQETDPPAKTVTVFVADGPSIIDSELTYDPARSQTLFEEAGYAGNQPITILYPAEDNQLAAIAELAVESLGGMGIDAAVEEVPEGGLTEKMQMIIAAGEQVIALSR